MLFRSHTASTELRSVSEQCTGKGCDAKRLQPISPPLAAALASLSDQVRIVPVADDESGTCIIEMPDEIIDASASTQLSNIRGIVADVPADAPRQKFEIRGGGPGRVPQYDSTGL